MFARTFWGAIAEHCIEDFPDDDGGGFFLPPSMEGEGRWSCPAFSHNWVSIQLPFDPHHQIWARKFWRCYCKMRIMLTIESLAFFWWFGKFQTEKQMKGSCHQNSNQVLSQLERPEMWIIFEQKYGSYLIKNVVTYSSKFCLWIMFYQPCGSYLIRIMDHILIIFLDHICTELCIIFDFRLFSPITGNWFRAQMETVLCNWFHIIFQRQMQLYFTPPPQNMHLSSG